MKYFIYETTNLINGKKYRGCHKTQLLNDGYLGSGKLLVRAIKKYGKTNFSREIIEFCESEASMYEREKIYVDENFVNSDNTYNLRCGGFGGRMTEEIRKIVSQKLKVPKTIETRQRMSQSQTGRKLSEVTKQKILNAIKNREPIKESTRVLLSAKAKLRKCYAKGTIWITNGFTNKRIQSTQPIPNTWYAGRTY